MRESSTAAVPSVAKAVEIVAALASAGIPKTLSELSRLLELPKSTTYGLVQSLTASGLIEHSAEDGYRLGARVVTLGYAYSRQLDLAEEFRRLYANETWSPTATVVLATLDGVRSAYLARRAGTSPIGHSTVGSTLPAYTTATGRAMLAYLPADDLKVLMSRFPPDGYVDSARSLQEALAQTRNRGYSVDDGETIAGVRAVGFPVFDEQRRAIAAVGMSEVTGSGKASEHAFLHSLRGLAAGLTRACGGVVPVE